MKKLNLTLNRVEKDGTGRPTEDGYYLVITDFNVHMLGYTVAGGWNTYYSENGELRTANKIAHENPYYWVSSEPFNALQAGLDMEIESSNLQSLEEAGK